MSAFASLGLSVELVSQTSSNLSAFRSAIKRYYRDMAFVVSPDTGNASKRFSASFNAAYTEVMRASDAELRKMITDFLAGKEGKEFGIRLELRQATDQLKDEQEKNVHLARQIEALKEKNEAVYGEAAEMIQLLLPNIESRLTDPDMIRPVTMAGQWLVSRWTYRMVHKTGYVKGINCHLTRVSYGGAVYTKKMVLDFDEVGLFRTCANWRFSQLLKETAEETVTMDRTWDSLGFLIGFSDVLSLAQLENDEGAELSIRALSDFVRSDRFRAAIHRFSLGKRDQAEETSIMLFCVVPTYSNPPRFRVSKTSVLRAMES